MTYSESQTVTHLFVDVNGKLMDDMELNHAYEVVRTTFVAYRGTRTSLGAQQRVEGQFVHYLAPKEVITEDPV